MTYSISHLNDDVCESYDIFLLSRQKVDDLLCSIYNLDTLKNEICAICIWNNYSFVVVSIAFFLLWGLLNNRGGARDTF